MTRYYNAKGNHHTDDYWRIYRFGVQQDYFTTAFLPIWLTIAMAGLDSGAVDNTGEVQDDYIIEGDAPESSALDIHPPLQDMIPPSITDPNQITLN